MNDNRCCQKYERCSKGKNCPLEYIPDTEWYRCFERKKSRERIEDCTRKELLEIIRIAYSQDCDAKSAIDKGLCKVKGDY